MKNAGASNIIFIFSVIGSIVILTKYFFTTHHIIKSDVKEDRYGIILTPSERDNIFDQNFKDLLPVDTMDTKTSIRNTIIEIAPSPNSTLELFSYIEDRKEIIGNEKDNTNSNDTVFNINTINRFNKLKK